jgi:hypothetical protein
VTVWESLSVYLRKEYFTIISYCIHSFLTCMDTTQMRLLIDWFWFYAVLVLFQPYYGDRVEYCVWFWKFGFPWRPPVSLLFFEHQGNDVLRAKGVVILDTRPNETVIWICSRRIEGSWCISKRKCRMGRLVM